MQTLGNYILRSPVHAVAATCFLTMLGLILTPFLYVFSGTPLALLSLRKGWKQGTQVLFASVLVMVLLTTLAGMEPVITVAIAVMVWLPVLICSAALRAGRGQGMMFLAAGLVSLVFLLYVHVVLEPLLLVWQQWFAELKNVAVDSEMVMKLEELYQLTSPLLTTSMSFGFLLSLCVTMLLARWWQSRLVNPGGFREEFYALRLPRALQYFTLMIIAVMLLQPDVAPALLRDMMALMMLLYLFQGLAVIHRFVSHHKLRKSWLVAVYCLLILPYMILFVSCVGLADAWLRKSRSDGNSDRD